MDGGRSSQQQLQTDGDQGVEICLLRKPLSPPRARSLLGLLAVFHPAGVFFCLHNPGLRRRRQHKRDAPLFSFTAPYSTLVSLLSPPPPPPPPFHPAHSALALSTSPPPPCNGLDEAADRETCHSCCSISVSPFEHTSLPFSKNGASDRAAGKFSATCYYPKMGADRPMERTFGLRRVMQS